MSAARGRQRMSAPIAVRADGLSTRKELLEAAGFVFAEHGYAAATSKEICRRAAANAGAVNYHFGGKYALYVAVLEEARHRLLDPDVTRGAAQSNADLSAWLRMLLTRVVTEIAHRGAWELRVLVREIISSSPLVEGLVNHHIAPKARLARARLAQVMDLPIEHPAVSRSLVSVIGPCIVLVMASADLQRKAAPHLELQRDDLIQHVLTFVFAGLRAVARQARAPLGNV